MNVVAPIISARNTPFACGVWCQFRSLNIVDNVPIVVDSFAAMSLSNLALNHELLALRVLAIQSHHVDHGLLVMINHER